MNNLLQKNLSVLNKNYLFFDAHKTHTNSPYVFSKARKDETVPSLSADGGTPADLHSMHLHSMPLHSMIDPVREAERLVSTVPQDTGFIIFLGLGGGFAPKAALEQTDAQVAVIDFDNDGIIQLLSNIDYTEIFSNSRFTFLANPPPSVVKSFLLENYNPALCGGIKVIPLRTRTDFSKSEFNETAAAIEDSINSIADDYSVQVRFGRCWFGNIIRNVKTFSNNKHNYKLPEKINKTAIIAAGPSLDMQINSIEQCKVQGFFIISCDTALPVLLHHGIEPDAVVSIDCQHISYHHFIGCYSRLKASIKPIPLILDIASPPLLTDFSSAPLFFSSGHPLALYISHNFYPFPYLDTSGGNVTYACLSLAELMCAQDITVFGADFSYIGSRTYARGSYIDRVFDKKQNRFSALEKLFSSFLYRSNFLPPVQEGQKYFETSMLRSYRRKFEDKISLMAADIKIAEGLGAPINIKKTGSFYTSAVPKSVQIKNAVSGIDFLKQYRDDIAALHVSKDNISKSPVLMTLLPFTAFLKQRNPQLKTKDLLEEVKRQCVKEIDKILN